MSGSLALQALICIRIAAREGQWVLLRELCAYLAAPHSIVLRACQDLERTRLLTAHRAAGTGEIYAVRTPTDELHPQDRAHAPPPAQPPLPRDLSAISAQGDFS